MRNHGRLLIVLRVQANRHGQRTRKFNRLQQDVVTRWTSFFTMLMSFLWCWTPLQVRRLFRVYHAKSASQCSVPMQNFYKEHGSSLTSDQRDKEPNSEYGRFAQQAVSVLDTPNSLMVQLQSEEQTISRAYLQTLMAIGEFDEVGQVPKLDSPDEWTDGSVTPSDVHPAVKKVHLNNRCLVPHFFALTGCRCSLCAHKMQENLKRLSGDVFVNKQTDEEIMGILANPYLKHHATVGSCAQSAGVRLVHVRLWLDHA